MSRNSAPIILSILITLAVCTRSHYLDYGKSGNVTFYHDNYADSIVVINNVNYDDIDSIRISGGKYAKLKEFPYMAVVHHLLDDEYISQCGGTILSKRWVLTAGHCVVDRPHRFFVVFGIIDKSGIGYDSLRGPGDAMITTRAFVHPHYLVSHNDIALLRMPRDIVFSKFVQPIKLAYHDESFVNRNASVIGWGKQRTIGKVSERLQYTTLPVISNNECKKYWQISGRHICTAAGLGRDACQGDSGGPLVVKQGGQHVQIGIVSYGDEYCPSNKPGVFTRVSSFRDWIHQITNIIY